MIEPIVSSQQRVILMASMILIGEDLKLVEALGNFYAIFLQNGGEANVNLLVARLNHPDWSRDVVAKRLMALTKAGYLEKEHYRSWRLNVDKILSLNERRSRSA